MTAFAAAVTLAGAAYAAAPATAATTPPDGYAPAETAIVHPGVQTLTNGAQCTSNFVYTDGTNTYLGQAAHCSGTGGNTETNGCTAQSLPDGTPVDVLADDGTTIHGTMAYNSWNAMQAVGEKDADTCAYNDLALIKISDTDKSKLNPSVPIFGGPTGVATTGTQVGDRVYSYGNSELRLGLSPLSPKTGISVGDDGNGWSHGVYTLSPGIPGDSGSGFLTADGEALGVLSTLEVAPVPASNNVGDLYHELSWLNAHPGQVLGGSGQVTLVPGDVDFNGGGLTGLGI